MDYFEYFKEVAQREIAEMKKRNPNSQKTKDIEEIFSMILNPNFETRSNINVEQIMKTLQEKEENGLNIDVEQRIKNLYEREKSGFNPQLRDTIANSIDSDVGDWFFMIKNQFMSSKHKSISSVERFFKEIDALIQIEELAISLYIKEMPNMYIVNMNGCKKRILLLLSEKSKAYKTLEGELYYLSDDSKLELLKKFNQYLEEIKELEKTYVPPMFDKKLYGVEGKRKIIKTIILFLIWGILIGLGIWSYIYDKTVFKLFIAIIEAVIVMKAYHYIRRTRRKIDRYE